MLRPPIAATSCATAMLDTVARPRWLSGIRNDVGDRGQHPDLVPHVPQIGPGRRLDLTHKVEHSGNDTDRGHGRRRRLRLWMISWARSCQAWTARS